jgi:hypothetical protein
MKKSEYQNPKYETMFKIQIFKFAKQFLSFVFWSFEFVSNFDIRISNFYLKFLNQVHDDRKSVSPVQLQRGQALITLLFFMIIAITITSAAVVILLTNSVSAQKLEQGTVSYYTAESGAENALLRLLRDPNYTGETLTIDGTTVVATVTKSGSVYTITSSATFGNFKRTIQVVATYVGNILTATSWKEEF